MADTSRVSRVLPQATADGSDASNRGGRYGEQIIAALGKPKYVYADEGSYFVITNPTPVTAIAVTTSITTFAETAGAVGVGLLVRNSESASGSAPKRVYMDYLKLHVGGAPTSATAFYYALTLDYSAVRYTSGGSEITPVNVNGDSSLSAVSTVYFGAITTGVPVDRRLVGFGILAGSIPLVKDSYILNFGGDAGGTYVPIGAMSSPANRRIVIGAPPVVIGPGQNLCLTMWGASNAAAATFEFEGGFWER